MEELILAKAKELFFSCGIKSVSMDDISKNAAISKKTIYKSFQDKNQVVERLVAELLSCYTLGLKQSNVEASDAVEEMILSTEMILNSTSEINPAFFYDLKKFFPHIWRMMDEHNKNVLMPFIAYNLKKGINDELYRSDINILFTANIRFQQIITVFDVKTFSERLMGSTKTMLQLTDFYLHAIATPKGKRLINKYLNVINESKCSI